MDPIADSPHKHRTVDQLFEEYAKGFVYGIKASIIAFSILAIIFVATKL